MAQVRLVKKGLMAIIMRSCSWIIERIFNCTNLSLVSTIRKELRPMTELNDAQLLTVVQNMVEKHGCKIADFDLDKKIINLEGPEDAKANCARAIVEILG